MFNTSPTLHLYLFPSLRNLEEETSCRRDVRQSSIHVPERVLHHALTSREGLHLTNKHREVQLHKEEVVGLNISIQ